MYAHAVIPAPGGNPAANPRGYCSGRYWARTSDLRLVEAETGGQRQTPDVSKRRDLQGVLCGRLTSVHSSMRLNSILEDALRTHLARDERAALLTGEPVQI